MILGVTAMGQGKKKFRIQDTEFAVLVGGPYDGLKLSRVGKQNKYSKEPQIGLPTPQYLRTGEHETERSLAFVYDIVFEEDYEVEETTTQNFNLVGDEVIAVYTDTGVRKKYCEVFDRVPRKLKKLSRLLNVTTFKFDYYAQFRDINESVE